MSLCRMMDMLFLCLRGSAMDKIVPLQGSACLKILHRIVTKRSSSTPPYADLATKTYLFFDVIHLLKNIRNNLLNQKKFVFPSLQFELLRDAIHVLDGSISLRIFHEMHERDANRQVYLRKSIKSNEPGDASW